MCVRISDRLWPRAGPSGIRSHNPAAVRDGQWKSRFLCYRRCRKGGWRRVSLDETRAVGVAYRRCGKERLRRHLRHKEWDESLTFPIRGFSQYGKVICAVMAGCA